MTKYYIIALSGVILTAISQILLKHAAVKTASYSLIKKYINPFVMTAYFLLFIVTLMNLFAYKLLPIKLVVVFYSSTFVLVALFSYLILKEKINRQQFIGSVVILIGVFVYNL